MHILLMAAALVQPADAPGGMPPEQVLASIDGKGKMTITYVACTCNGQATREHDVTARGEKGKVKVTSVVVTTAELSAKLVEAYTVDGKRIAAEKLAEMLAKDRPVLASMDGKKIDPFLLTLYKDDTIVIVPPANTLGVGYVGGEATVPMVIPAPLPPVAPPAPPRIP
jgi:hypothetical protein